MSRERTSFISESLILEVGRGKGQGLDTDVLQRYVAFNLSRQDQLATNTTLGASIAKKKLDFNPTSFEAFTDEGLRVPVEEAKWHARAHQLGNLSHTQ
eukprot:879301-Amphidinium_carterae.1